MDWQATVIAYCERADAGFWAEPVNAVTNAAFLIAAAFMATRLRGLPGMGLGWLMVGLLAAIGVGSFLWHTFATRWAGLADVLPILLFILTYVFAATRDLLRLHWGFATLAVVAFLPYAAAVSWGIGLVFPGAGANASYASVALLIVLYGLAVRRRAPATARGLYLGAGILSVSLGFRMVDDAVCASVPLGTHFMWHLLNGVMLGWMIEVYRRHRIMG
jgi:hypothetical protein